MKGIEPLTLSMFIPGVGLEPTTPELSVLYSNQLSYPVGADTLLTELHCEKIIGRFECADLTFILL